MITIDSDVYNGLVKKIDYIYNYVLQFEVVNVQPEANPETTWIRDEKAAEILRLSLRTMKRLRSKGEISYSICKHKVYYTLVEILWILSEQVRLKNNG